MNRVRSGLFKTILGGILCVIFIPVIVINLVLIFSTYANPGDMPGVFGIKPVIVLSGSMEPEIRTGDMIFLHKTDPAQLMEGDVICYLTSGKAVTHRIVEISTGEDGRLSYITRGDANNTEDRLAVTADQVQGIWKGWRIAGMGKFVMFMQSQTGMLLFIVCPLLLFILWDIWRRKREVRAESERRAELEAELELLKAEHEQVPGQKTKKQ